MKTVNILDACGVSIIKLLGTRELYSDCVTLMGLSSFPLVERPIEIALGIEPLLEEYDYDKDSGE